MSWAIWLFVVWPLAAFAVVALFHGAHRRAERERSPR